MAWITEACLGICADAIMEQVLAQVACHCTSQHRNGLDYIMIFDAAKATVRCCENILLRIEADDFLTCEGLQALLEATIADFIPHMPKDVFWLEADIKPFSAILAHLDSRCEDKEQT